MKTAKQIVEESAAEVLEEAKLSFKKGDKVTYLGHPGVITSSKVDIQGREVVSVRYNKGAGSTKASDIFVKGGDVVKESGE